MCQTKLDIILVHDYSLDGACYNNGNGVECKCGDMSIHQNYLVEFSLGTCHFSRSHDIQLL